MPSRGRCRRERRLASARNLTHRPLRPLDPSARFAKTELERQPVRTLWSSPAAAGPRQSRRVHLAGSSLGGSAALVAATNISPPVASVVSLSAPAHFRRQDALGVAPRLRLPVLYVASQDEPVGIADDARALHEATASTDKRLEIVPGTRHGLRILEASSSARALVEKFLRAH